VIGDKFRVARLLGVGSFGRVYLVDELSTGAVYALKALRDELVLDPRTRDLFRKEARIWVDLERHPYLVRAFHAGELQGRQYLAMEYVAPDEDGLNSLEGFLRADPPDLAQSLRWAVQLCHGMEHAEAHGLRCHRDIKPANVLIGQDGAVRITDLGIAGLQPDTTSAVFGSPTHMSPEQFVNAARANVRSDVYSFGVVLFQMATKGRLPFPLPDFPAAPDGALRAWRELEVRHRETPPPRIDSPLAPVIGRCLEKSPARRYPSFAELRGDLEGLLLHETEEVLRLPRRTDTDAWELSNKGLGLMALGRPQEALACYDRAIARNPLAAAVHNNRGNALVGLDRFDEGLLAFAKASELDPRYAAPWANKARSLASKGRDAEALECFERAVALNPRSAATWNDHGALLGRMGRPDAAGRSHDRALELRGLAPAPAAAPEDKVALNDQGSALHRAGRLEEALSRFNEAIARDERYGIAWRNKGACLGDLGRLEEALLAFDQGLALEPDLATGWSSKAACLKKAGRWREALGCLQESIALDPSQPVIWGNRAECLAALGDLDGALAAREKALALEPTSESLGAAVRAAREARDLAAPPSVAPPSVAPPSAAPPPPPPPPTPAPPAVATGHAPQGAEEWHERGEALFRDGRFEDALASFDRTLAIDPWHAAAWSNKGNCLFKMGRTEEGLTCANRALEVDPHSADTWAHKAAMENALARPAEALASFREFLDLPGSPAGLIDQARRAVEQIEKAGTKPARRSALGWLGEAIRFGAQKQYGRAIDAAEQALALDRRLEMGWLLKGQALLDTGRAEDALATYEEGLRDDPRSVRLWHAKGLAFARQRRFEEAVRCYDRALESDTRHAASWSDRGRALGAMDRPEESVRSLEKAIGLDPKAPVRWFNKALAEDALGRRADAARSYAAFLERVASPAGPDQQKAIEHARGRLVILASAGPPAAPLGAEATRALPASEPGPAPVGNLVSRGVEALQAGQAKEALRLFDQAALGEPENALLWTSRATALNALERFDEAVASATRALELNPRRADAWHSKAAALYRLKRYPEAIECADRATALSPAPRAPASVARAEDAAPTIAAEAAALTAAECEERGALSFGRGQFEEALAWYEQALAKDPASPARWAGKGESLRALGRHEEALPAYDEALARDPRDVASWLNKAAALDGLTRHEETVACCDRALDIAPNHLPALNAGGLALLALGRLEQALRAFDQALLTDPHFALARFNKACVEERLGRPADAVRSFQQFLAVAPPALANQIQHARARQQALESP
jgi:tetratricopeptide (TPR) repeat protein